MLRREFLRLAKMKYGNAFEYPYLPETVKRCVISVICKIHGNFEVIARDHLRTKYGCPHCAYDNSQVPIEVSNQKQLEKADRKFSGKFDYSRVDLKTERGRKVTIVCPLHDSFESTIRNHLHTSAGCPGCGKMLWLDSATRYKTLADAIEASYGVHGDKYDYLSYCSQTKLLKYSCRLHGEQTQQISSHLTGRGCMQCGRIERTITPDEFLQRAKQTHPSGYEYDLSELKSVNDKITITHECGRVYRCRVSNHLSGQGCMRCKSSLGEAKIRKFLDANVIPYIDQFKIDGFQYRYDFYLPELNILVEYDGQQHFEPVGHFGGYEHFQKTIERDRRKTDLAKKRGITLIRISYHHFANLEEFLSRAIDRRFRYRVDGVFYRNADSLCNALGWYPKSLTGELEQYRTLNVLKPA